MCHSSIVLSHYKCKFEVLKVGSLANFKFILVALQTKKAQHLTSMLNDLGTMQQHSFKTFASNSTTICIANLEHLILKSYCASVF